VLLCGGGWSGGEDCCAVGVKVTRAFAQNEVVCDYNGKLLTNKEGKEKYKNSQEQAMGYMFAFYSRGTPTLLSTAHLRPVM